MDPNMEPPDMYPSREDMTPTSLFRTICDSIRLQLEDQGVEMTEAGLTDDLIFSTGVAIFDEATHVMDEEVAKTIIDSFEDVSPDDCRRYILQQIEDEKAAAATAATPDAGTNALQGNDLPNGTTHKNAHYPGNIPYPSDTPYPPNMPHPPTIAYLANRSYHKNMNSHQANQHAASNTPAQVTNATPPVFYGTKRRPAFKPYQMPIIPSFPEVGSLRHIILSHPRTRLWQPAELWTPKILQLLGCTVQPVEPSADMLACPVDNPAPTNFASHADFDIAEIQTERLSKISDPASRDRLIRDLFPTMVRLAQDEDSPDCEVALEYTFKKYEAGWESEVHGLKLYYRKKARDLVPTAHVVTGSLLQSGDGSLAHIPIMAFIDKTWMQETSKDNFKAREAKKRHWLAVLPMFPNRNVAESEARFQGAIDPYYVGIIIAMAQRYRVRLGKDGIPRQLRPVYLVTPHNETRSLRFYTANISRNFMWKFRKPGNKFFDDGVTVTVEDVPFSRPMEIFRAVQKALDRGQFGLGHIRAPTPTDEDPDIEGTAARIASDFSNIGHKRSFEDDDGDTVMGEDSANNAESSSTASKRPRYGQADA